MTANSPSEFPFRKSRAGQGCVIAKCSEQVAITRAKFMHLDTQSKNKFPAAYSPLCQGILTFCDSPRGRRSATRISRMTLFDSRSKITGSGWSRENQPLTFRSNVAKCILASVFKYNGRFLARGLNYRLEMRLRGIFRKCRARKCGSSRKYGILKW